MNPKEIKIAERVAELLNSSGSFIIDVKTPHQTKSNLILLKALGDINKMRGLVITLERPHHYLTYLLGIQGVSQRNLTYVDLAYSKVKKIVFPIKISKENRKVIGGFIEDEYIRLEDFKFIMIDNISSAKIYLSKNSIIEFIHYLIEEAASKKLLLLLPIDISREKDLYNTLKDFNLKEINFQEVMDYAN